MSKFDNTFLSEASGWWDGLTSEEKSEACRVLGACAVFPTNYNSPDWLGGSTRDFLIGYGTACRFKNKRIKTQEAALAEARKGLEFYADTTAWSHNESVTLDNQIIPEDLHGDGCLVGGKTARVALSKIDELLKTNQNT